jgi:hypothetical protein
MNSKDFCVVANTSGGTIVLGIEESKKAIHELLVEIGFFAHILEKGEMKDSVVLSYCIPRIRNMLMSIDSTLNTIKDYHGIQQTMVTSRNHLDVIKNDLKKWLDDDQYKKDIKYEISSGD